MSNNSDSTNLDLHVASADERLQAFANVHEVWPVDPDPKEHVRKRSANPKYENATWYVGTLDGRVVASCGCYHVSVRIDGVVERTCAVGAVHTVPECRGRGFAPRLLEFAESREREARKTFSLLYSDIGAPYYARLGYQPCAAYQGWVNPAESKADLSIAAPLSNFRPLERESSLSTLIELYDGAHQHYPLSIARSSDYWRYLLSQSLEDEFYLDITHGKPWGYVRLGIKPDRIVIRDIVPMVLDDYHESATSLYSAVIALAKDRGAPRVGGWMPSDAVTRELFEVTDRVKELTMIKPLVDRIKVDERHCQAATHFHEIDHV
ncbi:MAG TPA: GNAT family N-acetyltransferase [Planctomycetaceae bacterium]|jgi:predicted acetyltransferase|nr:GNAT family N-acetyltransferase [Planctomycetaceae bacterium]